MILGDSLICPAVAGSTLYKRLSASPITAKFHCTAECNSFELWYSAGDLPRTNSWTVSAASSMSRRYFADSGGIERHAVPVRDLEEVRILRILGADEINLPPEKCLERFQQSEEPVSQIHVVSALKLIEKVDVTRGVVEVAARRGAEEFETRDTVRAA